MTKSAWAAFLVVCCAATAYSANPTWYEIKSPHFRVLTDGSEKQGREVAREFEQIRAVMATVLPSLQDSTVPLIIVAVRDEASAKRLVPEYWKRAPVKPAGVFRDGFEKRLSLVRLDLVRRGAETQLASFAYQPRVSSKAKPMWVHRALVATTFRADRSFR